MTGKASDSLWVDLCPQVECTCVDVGMGSYDAHEELIAPWGEPIGIDRCLAPLVEALWAAGIRTVASCCGHGVAPQTLVVCVEDRPWNARQVTPDGAQP